MHMCIGLSCDAHEFKSVFFYIFDSNPSSVGCMLENGVLVEEFLAKLSNVQTLHYLYVPYHICMLDTVSVLFPSIQVNILAGRFSCRALISGVFCLWHSQ